MKKMTNVDYAVLKSIEICDDNAYGVPVRHQADILLNRSLSVGARRH